MIILNEKKIVGKRVIAYQIMKFFQDKSKKIVIIAAKKKGRKRPSKAKAAEPERPGNVVDIMDALRRSIAAESGNKRR